MPKCPCTRMPAPGQETADKPKTILVTIDLGCERHAPEPDPVMLGDLP